MVIYTDEIKKMNLWEKISQISNEVEYLQKDDVVGFGKNSYKAISIEKVVTAVAEKMAKYGVVIYPIHQEYTRKDEEVTKSDGTRGVNRISDVNVKYEVVNIHNVAEKIITVSSGTGVDVQDKGIGKAMTYAYKNMVIKLFNIATGDDTDKIHSDDYTKKLYGEPKQVSSNLSEAQIKRLYAIANKAKFDANTVAGHVKKQFNKAINELTKEEYDRVVAGYEKKAGA